MGLQERAAKLASYLTTAQRREGETIIVRTEDAPEWVADLVMAVHGDLFPDDWTYAAIRQAAEAIAEDGEDATVEPVIYTHNLLDWLANYPHAADYCDQAREDYGFTGGIIEQIGYGQSLALGEIVGAVISQLEMLDDEDETETED